MSTTTPTPTSTPTISQEVLDDLAERLARTRYSENPRAVKGMSTDRLRELVAAWQGADWRAVETWMDEHGSTTTTSPDGRTLHHLHVPGSDADAVPVVLLHGWPDSPLLYRRIMPAIIAAGHPVVVPSAAGFGWSQQPDGELSAGLVAEDMHALMRSLGYPRYLVHGTDWGASVGTALVEAHPEAVAGLHLLQPPVDRVFSMGRDDLTEAETAFFVDADAWAENAAYISAHSLQGDTLAAALEDSPAGLLAWIGEKYDAWSGPDIQDEDIIDAVAMLWLTGTFRSSIRLYSEPEATWLSEEDGETGGEDGTAGWGEPGDGDAGSDAGEEDWGGWAPARIEVPTAIALFPQDLMQPPRELCERFFNVERFTVHDQGGHWAALEAPHDVAGDLLAFAADKG